MSPRAPAVVDTSKCSVVIALPLSAWKAERSGHVFLKKFTATFLSHAMLKMQPACVPQEGCDLTP